MILQVENHPMIVEWLNNPWVRNCSPTAFSSCDRERKYHGFFANRQGSLYDTNAFGGRNPSKLPYISIVWFPQYGYIIEFIPHWNCTHLPLLAHAWSRSSFSSRPPNAHVLWGHVSSCFRLCQETIWAYFPWAGHQCLLSQQWQFFHHALFNEENQTKRGFQLPLKSSVQKSQFDRILRFDLGLTCGLAQDQFPFVGRVPCSFKGWM